MYFSSAFYIQKNRVINGVAPNLIDKFLVLGYEQKSIDNNYRFYQDQDPNIKYKTFFKVFDFIEKPSIINEICYDYSKELLDNDLIVNLIFPNFPKMYFLEKQYINKQKPADDISLLTPYSIIFSINSTDNTNKKNHLMD